MPKVFSNPGARDEKGFLYHQGFCVAETKLKSGGIRGWLTTVNTKMTLNAASSLCQSL